MKKHKQLDMAYELLGVRESVYKASYFFGNVSMPAHHPEQDIDAFRWLEEIIKEWLYAEA